MAMNYYFKDTSGLHLSSLKIQPGNTSFAACSAGAGLDLYQRELLNLAVDFVSRALTSLPRLVMKRPSGRHGT